MLTNKQRKDRQKGVGGSDIGVILGFSKHMTLYQLYLDKKGLLPPIPETPQQYWGKIHEATIRKEFAKKNSVKIIKKESAVHPFYDFMRGNIDGYIEDWKAIFEAKTANSFMRHLWGGEDGDSIVPIAYIAQVAHYCSVLNLNTAYFGVLIGGDDYRQFRYDRKPELEDIIIKSASEFWDCVQNDTPPPPVKQIDYNLLYPRSIRKSSKQATQQIMEEVGKIKEIRYKIKELEEIQDKHKFSIMEYMQDIECLTDDSGAPIVTWKSGKKGGRKFLLKQLGG